MHLLLIFLFLHLFDFGEYLGSGLVYRLSAIVKLFFVGRPSLTKYLEAEDQGLVGEGSILWVQVWIGLK